MKNIIISEHTNTSKLYFNNFEIYNHSVSFSKKNLLLDNVKIYIQSPIEAIAYMISEGLELNLIIDKLNDFFVDFISLFDDKDLQKNITVFSSENFDAIFSETLTSEQKRNLFESLNYKILIPFKNPALLLLENSEKLKKRIFSLGILNFDNVSNIYESIDLYIETVKDCSKYKRHNIENLEVNGDLLNEIHQLDAALEKLSDKLKNSNLEKDKFKDLNRRLNSEKARHLNEMNSLKAHSLLLQNFSIAAQQKMFKDISSYKKTILKEISQDNNFNKEDYLNSNPDVKNENVDPFLHFVLYGWIERRYKSLGINSVDFCNKYLSELKNDKLPFIPRQFD